MSGEFAVAAGESPSITVSLESLPADPTVMVLPAAGRGHDNRLDAD